MGWLTEPERVAVTAALARLIPPGSDPAAEPGAAEAGVLDYIDGTLDAFAVSPPRIFAGGPFSGRQGGPASFQDFLPLSRLQEIAWRRRVETWQRTYRSGVAALGRDFATVPGEEQDRRLDAQPELKALLYDHACEGMYAAPEYGGNRDLAGWRLAGWPGDVVPRGWTPEEVSNP